jgi:hypothetical protein
MPNSTSRTTDAVDRFWDRFINNLRKQGVKEKQLHWYVIRAEQYRKAFPDKRLAHHGADDINTYLRTLGRKSDMTDWRFRQSVDAIQNLFMTAGIPSIEGVDWSFWRDCAITLSPDHATLAREPVVSAQEEVPASGKNFKEKRHAESALDDIRRKHSQILERLVAEIRRRKYSIRTEQAYEAWVCRFIAFHDNRTPVDLGSREITAFLEHLAVKGNVAASTGKYGVKSFFFPFG